MLSFVNQIKKTHINIRFLIILYVLFVICFENDANITESDILYELYNSRLMQRSKFGCVSQIKIV